MFSLGIIFTKLKPLVDTIIREPTKINIEILHTELEKIDCTTLQYFHDYFLKQLVVLVDNVDTINSNELKIAIIQTVNTILSKTKIKNIVAYKTLTIIAIQNLLDSQAKKIHVNLSEEFKIAFIESIRLATNSLSLDVVEEFYIAENMPFLSPMIFTCLEIIKTEKYSKLKIIAINCILTLMHVHDEVDFDDIVLQSQLSNVLFITTPKTFGVLFGVIHGDPKQGSQLISNAIKALGRILCLVMMDYEKPNNKIDLTIKDFHKFSNNSNVDEFKTMNSLRLQIENLQLKGDYMKTTLKSPEWIEAAVSKILPIMQVLNHLQVNDNLNIRKELASLFCCLLDKCSINMRKCVPNLIESLVALSEDECERIREKCLCSLLNFMQNHSDISESLEELFVKHLTRLPRVIHRAEDSEQQINFLLLKGFLKLLIAIDSKTILLNQQIFEKLLMVLISACELDHQNSNDLLKEEYIIYNFGKDNKNMQHVDFWKKYKNIESQLNKGIIIDICALLSDPCTSSLLLNSVLDNLTSAKYDSGSNTLLNLINNLILSLINKDNITEEQQKLLKLILEEVLMEWHWDLDIFIENIPNIERDEYGDIKWYEERTLGLYESAVEMKLTDIKLDSEIIDKTNYITMTDVKINILHNCLILENIGLIARVLKNDFKPYIFKSLHRVLEKAGNNNSMIQMTAIHTLHQMIEGLQLSGMNELIHDNSDYLTYHVNVSLKKFEKSSSGLDIITVILKYSLIESMPYLETIINTVLDRLGENYRPRNITSHLKLLKYFVLAVQNWEKSMPVTSKIDNETAKVSEKSLLELWQFEESDDDVMEEPISEAEDIVPDEPEPNNEEEDKKIIPQHIQVTINVLKICLKYIPSFEQSDKIIILETLNVGLLVLKNYEDELLPVVHLIWEPFSERFKESNPIILSRSFELLITLSKVAKSFILKRTLTDVVPILNKFLLDSSKESQNHGNDVSYTLTQQFKLQRKLLEEYPELLIEIEIQERNLNDISDIVCDNFWRKNKQPKPLRDAAEIFFNKLKAYNAPFIHVKLYEQ